MFFFYLKELKIPLYDVIEFELPVSQNVHK